ncbi:lytic transglycosylase domain-containing protein [Acinetobacter chinensis]|uniref:Lytic transglycosylase domain-containing protein n=2 Tax=Moraxellaceae TaxID=468 RepID=A0A3B7LWQ0_9GAMM|nr:lytic transglycosylase domain-containing protein [Acinetobacter chinensis]
MTSLKFLNIQTVFLSVVMISLAGCSSLGGGSIQKRASKLSNGIQNAYSVAPETANRISPIIVQNAEKYSVDPLLLAAMIQQESSYRNYVVSPAGAVGLTQVIPRYWQKTCPGDLFEENTNINCGTYILAKYNDSAGSWKKALAWYNVGPTGYSNSWKMKRQGKKYARQVKAHQKNLKNAL